MAGMRSVYALVDPWDGTMRYVGQTYLSLRVRLTQHIGDAERDPDGTDAVHQWIRELLSLGERPTIVLLERVPHGEERDAERHWRERLASQGVPLLNCSGTPGMLRRENVVRPAALDGDDPPAPLSPLELRDIRREIGLTQAQLARALGAHYSTVCRWESGERRIPAAIRLALDTLRTR